MPLISLRESLARAKDKWKTRFRTGVSNTDSVFLSTQNISTIPAGTVQDSSSLPPPFDPAPDPSVLRQSNEIQSSSPSQTGNLHEKGTTAWSGVKTLLAVLESSADAFGPLKSAIGGLNKCISIYEGASKGRKDYAELYHKLDGLLSDLSKHMSEPMGLEMTNSVVQLCRGIQAEIRNVEAKQARSRMEQLVMAMDVSGEIYECYHRIHDHMERLILNATIRVAKEIDIVKMETLLNGILPSKSAMYNSAEAEVVKRGNCAPGTREPQIELLMEWAHNPETGRTCWVNGMAGTGKTTIAYTVCDKLDQFSQLGASFFCSRDIPECRQVKYIIPSVAYQLARFSLPFRYALVKVLESNQDAHARGLKIQYQQLIAEPLRAAHKSLPADLVVVIDALDECEGEDTVGPILDLLLSTASTMPIRFLVSSRPEGEIMKRMADRVDEEGDRKLVLHDLDSESVRSDIRNYMKHELGHVPLTDVQWSSLTDQCGVLFIYASTTCRYIEQAYKMDTLDETVSAIIDSSSMPVEPGDKDPIDNLYLTILAAAFEKPGMTYLNKMRMKNLLETVICAVEPMTLDALAAILGLKSLKQVDALLQPLRSVLNVTNITGIVVPLHASFPDFMLDPGRSTKYHCEQASRHSTLTKACLRMIETAKPQFNICGLTSSHLFDDEVEDIEKRVSQALPSGLTYACRYWSTHLSLSEYQGELMNLVCDFFAIRLLLWMEVLNLTKCMRHGTSIIYEVEKWCSKHSTSGRVATLAHDAWQFVSVYANHPVSRSTPHIYTSMLPFWPRSRPISQAYMPKTVGVIQPTGTAITGRQLSLLATWKISSRSVTSINLSYDGSRIAAAIGNTIKVLDASTGDSLLNLTPEHSVLSVAISPNDTHVLFCCDNSTVYFWDTHNGDKVTELLSAHHSSLFSGAFSPDLSRVAFGGLNGNVYIYSLQERELVLGPLKAHNEAVASLAFSPDGLYLASGSQDRTICVWDVETGHVVGNPLEDHIAWIQSITYSSDGSRIASASFDKTIRVWDPQSGLIVLGPLKGHSNAATSVALSPNGRFVASGSIDQTIRVYDAQTGQSVLGPLRGHTHWVRSLVFSPDSTRLFSCSRDGTIRVWNVRDTHVPDVRLNAPSIPSSIQCVQYSHSGSRIASGSSDGIIYVWDVQTGGIVLGPLYGHTKSIWSLDYSPNDAYIASASNDKTLRIWDACNGHDIHGPIHGHGAAVNCVRFSPDSSLLASGPSDGTVRIWDVMSGQPLMKLLEGSNDGIRAVGFSPDGLKIVTGSSRGNIRVLDRFTGQAVVGPLRGHRQSVSSVEFSPDGSRILSASSDGSINLWDVQTGQRILSPSKHSLKRDVAVNSAAFSPDGHFIASCSFDRTISVWDAQSGDLVLGPLEGHNSFVRSVRYSPDGSHIVSCSSDRTIRFWDVSSCSTKSGQSGGEDEGKMPDSGQSDDKSYGLWTLDANGWVVDQRRRRLAWVPPDLQRYLLPAFNDLVIGVEVWVALQIDGANIGERWLDCYRP